MLKTAYDACCSSQARHERSHRKCGLLKKTATTSLIHVYFPPGRWFK